MPDTVPPIHLRLRCKIDDATERLALRAALTAAHLFGLATGIHLRTLRGHRDPLLDLQGRLEEADLKARLASEVAEILAARFGKIPERKRPHYSPAQRFRILEIKSLLGWGAHQAAQAFLVCPNTIHEWEHAADLKAFLGLEPAHLEAIEPPRGQPGEEKGRAPFRIAFLDGQNRRLPVLAPAA